MRATPYPAYCKGVTGDPNTIIERNTNSMSLIIPANVKTSAEVLPIRRTTAILRVKAMIPLTISTIIKFGDTIRSNGRSFSSKMKQATPINVAHNGAI